MERSNLRNLIKFQIHSSQRHGRISGLNSGSEFHVRLPQRCFGFERHLAGIPHHLGNSGNHHSSHPHRTSSEDSGLNTIKPILIANSAQT